MSSIDPEGPYSLRNGETWYGFVTPVIGVRKLRDNERLDEGS